MRGTQLSQLSEEYELCLDNVNRTAKILASKAEVLPDLERKLTDATNRYKEASKAREQQLKLEEVRHELAWAHVRDKGLELKAKLQQISSQDKRLPKIQETIKKAQVGASASSLKTCTELTEDNFGRAFPGSRTSESEAQLIGERRTSYREAKFTEAGPQRQQEEDRGSSRMFFVPTSPAPTEFTIRAR